MCLYLSTRFNFVENFLPILERKFSKLFVEHAFLSTTTTTTMTTTMTMTMTTTTTMQTTTTIRMRMKKSTAFRFPRSSSSSSSASRRRGASCYFSTSRRLRATASNDDDGNGKETEKKKTRSEKKTTSEKKKKKKEKKEESEEEEEDDDGRRDRALMDALLLKSKSVDDVGFETFVEENATRLTTLFFDRMLMTIEEKIESGEEKEAEELDALAGRTLMLLESRATFERASEIGFPETMRDSISAHEATLKKQLSANGSGGNTEDSSENYSIETQVKQRWAALTKAMEQTGTENALSQKVMNRERAKSSATELIGRAKLNTEEAKTLFTTAVPPERRIIEFLLEYEPGPERSQLLTDALTPPDEEDLKEMEENEEVEVVSTTAAKLSCALEVYLKEMIDNNSSSNGKSNSSSSDSDDDVVVRVRALAEEVKERL